MEAEGRLLGTKNTVCGEVLLEALLIVESREVGRLLLLAELVAENVLLLERHTRHVGQQLALAHAMHQLP
jgi:hypothetical protein